MIPLTSFGRLLLRRNVIVFARSCPLFYNRVERAKWIASSRQLSGRDPLFVVRLKLLFGVR
jgi:hypothetical protein